MLYPYGTVGSWPNLAWFYNAGGDAVREANAVLRDPAVFLAGNTTLDAVDPGLHRGAARRAPSVRPIRKILREQGVSVSTRSDPCGSMRRARRRRVDYGPRKMTALLRRQGLAVSKRRSTDWCVSFRSPALSEARRADHRPGPQCHFVVTTHLDRFAPSTPANRISRSVWSRPISYSCRRISA